MDAYRAIRSPHVLVLVVLGVVGVVGLWTMISWLVEVDSGALFEDGDPEAQRRSYLMSTLPYLLSGAFASAILGALAGLPLLIGARLVAFRPPPGGPSAR